MRAMLPSRLSAGFIALCCCLSLAGCASWGMPTWWPSWLQVGEAPPPMVDESLAYDGLPEKTTPGQGAPGAPPVAEGQSPAEQVDVIGESDFYVEEDAYANFGYGNVPLVRVPTKDGWNLAVYHYPPPSALGKVFPLVLVHGEGFNRLIWDYDERHSIARYLAENLYDVWVVELRGHGNSKGEDAQPGPIVSWLFEDYATDVSTTIDYVLAETGATQVALVGHSTGGTLVYGMMGNDVYSRKISIGVTMAAPTRFHLPNDTLTTLFLHRDKAWGQEYVDLRRGMYLPAPFDENIETVYSILFFNDFFLDPDLVERFGDVGFEPVRVEILRQFADWFAEERAYSTEDNTFNYNDDIPLIRQPLCVFVGWRDNIAEPANVVESLQEREKSKFTLELFGKMNGHQDYYGHLGLLLNDFAQVDVYPRVLECLDDASIKVEQDTYGTPGISDVESPYPDQFAPPGATTEEPFGQPDVAPEEEEDTTPGLDRGEPELPGAEEPSAPEMEMPDEGERPEEIDIEDLPEFESLPLPPAPAP